MYVTPNEVREMGHGLTVSSTSVPVTDALMRSVIERASRFFDLACGVDPGYFEAAYYPVWESTKAYVVGDIVTPATRNLHKYRVTTAGTSAASEPVFPTGSGATVTSGTVVFTEIGADVVATNKTIYGNGLNYLPLPPYVPGTLNTTLTYPTGYTALTFQEKDGYLIQTSSDGISSPFLLYSSGWYGGVPITVSAIWGYPETPEDVKLAVIELVINLLRETDPASIKLVGIDNQPLRERLPPRVAAIARRYQSKGVVLV